MSKVLIISTSLRVGSNSEALARECEAGAKAAGHEVEFVSLKGKKMGYCVGCLVCQKTQKCVWKDDVTELCDKVKNVDVLVFATPIYYYEMSGQMKTLLDRLNPLYPSDYKFRRIFLIATAAEEGDEVFEKAVSGLQGWIDCFPKAEFGGLAACGGVSAANSAKHEADALKQAYDLGAAL